VLQFKHAPQPIRKAVDSRRRFAHVYALKQSHAKKNAATCRQTDYSTYCEELAEAVLKIVIGPGYHKRSIEDHFDNMSADLRANLKQGGKRSYWKILRNFGAGILPIFARRVLTEVLLRS